MQGYVTEGSGPITSPDFETSLVETDQLDGWTCGMAGTPFAFLCGKQPYSWQHVTAAKPIGWGCGACLGDTSTSVDGRRSGRFVTGDDPTKYSATNYKCKITYGNYTGSAWLRGDRAGQVITVGLYNASLAAIPLLQNVTEHAIPDGGWHQVIFSFSIPEPLVPYEVTLGFAAKLTGVFWADAVDVTKL